MKINWTAKNLPSAATFSKDPSMWGLLPSIRVACASGAKVALEGNDREWLVDWTSALGANLLGQAADSHEMNHALAGQTLWGWATTLPSVLEKQAAERLAMLLGTHVPGWSSEDVGVRWCGTGTDAVAMGVRLARAMTGKEWVVTFKDHYHGWADWTVARTEPAHGLVKDGGQHAWLRAKVCDCDWGNLVNLDTSFRMLKPAALVFEHPPGDPPEEGWWDGVMELCDEHGVLLIADEVVTGLRCHLGGACGLWEIQPDLVCMGKALGNGLPVAALAGRRELMNWFARNDPVFCSSTSWGNSLSLAAANHVLGMWLEDGERHVARIWALGERLMEGLGEAGWRVDGHPPRSVLRFDTLAERKFFIEEMMRKGHLFNRPNFPNLAMRTGDVESAIMATRATREKFDHLGPDELDRMYARHELPKVLFDKR
jgi:glutamate-1-semialdehyde aminotransferase